MRDMNDASIIIVLHQIAHMSKYQAMRQMERSGLKPGQAGILFILNCEGTLSQRELAQEIGITPPSVTVALRKLEKMGCVAREPDEYDQRIVRIRLTEEGKRRVEGLKGLMEEMEEVIYEGMSAEERILLKRLLLEVRGNILNMKDFQGLSIRQVMKKTGPPSME